MARFTLDQVLQRARAALAMPTTYWLGLGGFQGAGSRPRAAPGVPLEHADMRRLLSKLASSDKAEDQAKAEAYEEGLAETGLTIEQLPQWACDCSGFVTWALGVPRHPSKIGWIDTAHMHADATGRQELFVKLEQARPGALLVYPDPGPGEQGHVGIISALDELTKRPSLVIHCAPENLRIEPASGGPRNAIAETHTARFDEVPATVIVALGEQS